MAYIRIVVSLQGREMHSHLSNLKPAEPGDIIICCAWYFAAFGALGLHIFERFHPCVDNATCTYSHTSSHNGLIYCTFGINTMDVVCSSFILLGMGCRVRVIDISWLRIANHGPGRL
jgi:hypothetical protein